MVALLAGASPRVVVLLTDIFEYLITLPKSDPAGSDVVDKRVSLAVLKNAAVMTPLMRFALLNAAKPPVSDREYAVARMGPMIRALCCSGGFDKKVAVAICTTLPPGRYGNPGEVSC